MERIFYFMPLFAAILLYSSMCHGGQVLEVYTEEFPPYQFTQNDRLTGGATEIVEAVLKKAGFVYTLSSFPWSRSYKMAKKNRNSLIFSISRSKDREKDFHWLGVLAPTKYSVFCLKNRNDIRITSLEDMKKYRIGTTRNDAREVYLKEKGFAESTLESISGENPNINNYKKLKTERIDLWPMPDAVAHFISHSMGDDPEKVIKRIFPLDEIAGGGYYLAANVNMDEKTASKIRNVLQTYRKTEEYSAILLRWNLENPAVIN